MVPASNENLKEGKRKSRLSSLFSSNKHNTANPENELEQDHHDQLEAHDSAYGGSEQNSTSNSATNVPTITDTEANAQGAKVTTSVDRTGRTITTTTTTTTTTVTTLGGDMYDVPAGSDVVVTKDGKNSPTELSARPLSREITEAEHSSATNPGLVQNQDESNLLPPAIPAKNNRRSMSPSGRLNRISETGGPSPIAESPGRHNFSYPARVPPSTGLHKQPSYPNATPQVPQQQSGPQYGHAEAIPPIPQQYQQYQQPQQQPQSLREPNQHPHQTHNPQSHDSFTPQIPPRYGSVTPSNATQHQAYNPSSTPSAQISSRPRPPVDTFHGNPHLDGTPQETMSYSPGQRPSTVQNLKTAAAGIHGAGEALRGVINSTVDKRMGASPEQLAKHESVINRGRAEIETGRYQRQQPPSVVEQDHLALPQEKEKTSRFRKVLRKSKGDLRNE